MKKIIKHIKKWNSWRKHSLNGRWHKLLVLLGIRYSPTFALYFTYEEREEFQKAFLKGVEEAKPFCLGKLFEEDNT